jgi:hypothetical protein
VENIKLLQITSTTIQVETASNTLSYFRILTIFVPTDPDPTFQFVMLVTSMSILVVSSSNLPDPHHSKKSRPRRRPAYSGHRGGVL